MIPPETHRFADDGRFPNSTLPLLVYRRALSHDPTAMERVFAAHGWSNAWRNGVFAYHHFHSIAHEVLGIAAGQVDVIFGGPSGRPLTLQADDAVVIPAGVAHCNVGQGAGLVVVGAYPGGSDYDTRRGDPAEIESVRRNSAAVPLLACDPVAGPCGALRALWAINRAAAGRGGA